MNAFDFVATQQTDEALAQVDRAVNSNQTLLPTRFIAGGTNILDLMKENVTQAGKLVDINALSFNEILPDNEGGLVLGAMARNADTAYHPEVRRRYPLLSNAILAGASAQIRNMASNGGNLLQRTRCYYFFDTGVPCNKRSPGSGCPAIAGLSRQHAILGASAHCIATHPSDMCVALAALDATVQVRSLRGERSIAFADFHRLPGDHPEIDNTLADDELITHIALPDGDHLTRHSVYLKFRERASYSFALVSVAAALDIAEDGSIRDARLALGGVAHKPWRKREAEAMLIGHSTDTLFYERAAEALLAGAVSHGDNHFKIEMAQRAIVRALQLAAQGTVDNHTLAKEMP